MTGKPESESTGKPDPRAILRGREQRSEPPVFVLTEGNMFYVERKQRGRGTKSLIKMDEEGYPEIFGVESIEPLDPREAEAKYIRITLELFQAMDRFQAARIKDVGTDLYGPEMELISAQGNHRKALGDLLDSGFEEERIDRELHPQLTHQIVNSGLAHIGEAVPQEKGNLPYLDETLRNELHERALREKQGR